MFYKIILNNQTWNIEQFSKIGHVGNICLRISMAPNSVCGEKGSKYGQVWSWGCWVFNHGDGIDLKPILFAYGCVLFVSQKSFLPSNLTKNFKSKLKTRDGNLMGGVDFVSNIKHLIK